MAPKYYIYIITSPYTGNVLYVGSTKDVDKRAKGHIWMKQFMIGVKDLRGVDRTNFSFPIEVIDEADSATRYAVENYWIGQFHAWGFPLINRAIPGLPRRHRTIVFSNPIPIIKYYSPYKKSPCSPCEPNAITKAATIKYCIENRYYK